jgi:hypothetical protein
MLTRVTAKQIGKGGFRLAAILAGLQLPVAVAKVASHSVTVAGVGAKADCAGQSAIDIAMAVGQTAWSMLDACLVGQLVHAGQVLLTSDSPLNPVRAVAGIIGHELIAHIVSFAFQILS